MDPLTMTAKIKPANTGGNLTGSVQFSIGGVVYGAPVAVVPIPGDTEGTVQATLAPQVSNLPSASLYTVTALFSSTNNNYQGSTQSKTVTVLQRNASPYNDNIGFYTGSPCLPGQQAQLQIQPRLHYLLPSEITMPQEAI